MFAMSDFLPTGANASTVACWWSLKNLIEQNPGKCWFWTLTFKEVVPDNYASNMHRMLMLEIAHAQERGEWPKDFGGVKVVEIHPGGHGLHFHWVVKPRIPIRVLLRLSKKCGFGRIGVHSKPATPHLAKYLLKYLIKGDKIHSLRKWGCIGDYKGVRANDVAFESNSIAVFRMAYREAIASGKPKSAAWREAKFRQREFDHNSDNR